MNETIQSTDILTPFPEERKKEVDQALLEASQKSHRKIVVLDDDPTGVQTVSGIHVYTDWSRESIAEGFAETNPMFFVLTNSRGMTRDETISCHREIAANVLSVSQSTGKDFLLISRSDSTLRGHYPLETEVLRTTLEEGGYPTIDGEILCPYFREGGRYTVGNVHYVRYGDTLVPAGQTEFAKDATFGYRASNLCEYVEEKTGGACKKENCIVITQEDLRGSSFGGAVQKLLQASHFQKIIINAQDDYDVRAFAVCLYRAMEQGKHYLIRGAAAIAKAVGAIPTRPLLTAAELFAGVPEKLLSHGGMIVVGSHTDKTTRQLRKLQELDGIKSIPMASDLVLQEGALDREVARILAEADACIEKGITALVYTQRAELKVPNDTPEQALMRSVAISDAVQRCVGELAIAPSFVVAKGGITSSDVGTKALRVHRALVLGQIAPGVPVWQTGEESRFPGIPYVIFPGNVGEDATLKDAVSTLLDRGSSRNMEGTGRGD